MTKDQIEACRSRNEQLKRDIAAQKIITVKRAAKATEDIDNLLIDLDVMTERARLEQASRLQWERDLAAERRLKQACMHTVEPLRDKLSKAREILKLIQKESLSPKHQKYMKDIVRN